MELTLKIFIASVVMQVAPSDYSKPEEDTCFTSLLDQGANVDCFSRGLTNIPDNLPLNTVWLDLTENNINTLKGHAFRAVVHLEFLNLTNTNISSISQNAFSGLTKLRNLYLDNNPVIYRNKLSRDVFEGCPNIEKLSLRGWPVSVEPVLILHQLKELTVTPSGDNLPYQLVNMTNLRCLNFVFPQHMTYLTKSHMEPFSKMDLEELAFYGGPNNDIILIENGTFDSFNHLRLLNFAFNRQLLVDDVIDVLSNSLNLTVEILVLDHINFDAPWQLGAKDHPVCRSALTHLKTLTIRGTRLAGFTRHFYNCLGSLERLAIGSNNFLYDPSNIYGFRNIYNLRSVDAAYVLTDNTNLEKESYTSYSRERGFKTWIPENKDFLPPYLKRDCDVTIWNKIEEYPNLPDAMCSMILWTVVPPCITYINFHHANAWLEHQRAACFVFTTNAIKYLNASYMLLGNSGHASVRIIGLAELEVLDFSGIGTYNLPIIEPFPVPSLKVFKASNNLMSESSPGMLSNQTKIEEIDLSHNKFVTIQSVFSNLEHLLILRLHNNLLTNITFITKNLQTLEYLDVSENRLTHVNLQARSLLDEIFEKKKNFTLNLNKNPFECDCGDLEFVEWFQATTVNIKDRSMLTCLQNNVATLIMDINAPLFRIKCGMTVNRIVLLASLVGIVTFITTSMAITYKYRWALRWKLYKLRHLSRNQRNGIMANGDDDHLSAYVVFPMEDDGARRWVFECLLHKVEVDWEMPRMFLNGRDDIPGYAVVDNMVHGLMSSRIALWVLCPAFFEDKSCEDAAHFAFNHFGGKKNVIIMLENRLDQYQVPKRFYALVNEKMGIKKITYSSQNYEARRLFWKKLQDFFKDNLMVTVNETVGSSP